MGVSRLIVRLLIGGLFVGHGTQKLFGWSGGAGPDGTGEFFESVGLRPGRRHALAAGAAEAGGGLLLALGLATPVAGAALSSVMLGAIRRVHWKSGIWSANGGWEYNAVLLAVLFELNANGPGCLSLDALAGTKRQGMRWALGALLAGAAASTVATFSTEQEPAEEASVP